MVGAGFYVYFPEAKYQRCTVHFYRNVFSVVPRGRMREVSLMLKAIHAQENKEAAREKAAAVAAKLREMKLSAAAKKIEDGVDETLTYMDFPTEHWTRIRTNNVTERVNREIKRGVSRRAKCPDAGLRQASLCSGFGLGNQAVSQHGSSVSDGTYEQY